MDDEHMYLIAAANRAGARVTAPFSITIGDEELEFTALFHSFGGEVGTVTDPDWSKIEPHAQTLFSSGYGCSCVNLTQIDNDDMRDLLQDWGWFGTLEEKPDWM